LKISCTVSPAVKPLPVAVTVAPTSPDWVESETPAPPIVNVADAVSPPVWSAASIW
jgi:hypothetical protein